MRISIKFSLVPGTASDLPIRMRVGYAGKRLDIRTGFVCPPEKWDADAMRMKAGTTNRYHETASRINRELSRMESMIGEMLARHELDGDIPEPNALKEEFDIRTGRSKKSASEGVTLPEAITIMLKDRLSPKGSSSTYTFISLLNRLSDSVISGIKLDDLTDRDLSTFLGELWNEGLENNTVNEYLVKLRTALRYAYSNGLYHGRLHETFKPKLKGLGEKDVHFLEWSEFLQIYEVQLDDVALIAVRDSFCFCCATGLRISDCNRLRWSHVHLDGETPHISIIAQKTTKRTIVELNKYSRAILELQLSRGKRPDGLVFPPVNTRTRYNYLRRVARAAGLTGNVRELYFSGNTIREEIVPKADAISTHWARHTFIVRALSLGISPMVVMQWTGHASFESMKPYIAIAGSAKRQNMELFNTI